MLQNLARKLLGFFPVKGIGDIPNGVFFNRYSLLKTPLGSIYLHQFFRGDADLFLHDHPWSFVAIVLRGGYVEEVFRTEEKKVAFHLPAEHWIQNDSVLHERKSGSILIRKATTPHRIDSVKPGTWSLVFVSRKHRDWGFYGPFGWRKFLT